MELVCAAMPELLQAKNAVLLYSYAAVTGRCVLLAMLGRKIFACEKQYLAAL